jgi:hypothetical protein
MDSGANGNANKVRKHIVLALHLGIKNGSFLQNDS